jgi:hypothetical protein
MMIASVALPALAGHADDIFHTGNFALPTSQLPGPLVGFGQTLLDKGQIQLDFPAFYISGYQQHQFQLGSQAVFAITDNLTVQLSLPYYVSLHENQYRSAGFADAIVQVEYAFYNGLGHDYQDVATVVTWLTAPTGSSAKNPPTGAGSPEVFLGATFDRTYHEWLFYTSPGVEVAAMHGGTRAGTQWLYQFGAGRNVLTIDHRLLLVLQAELDGQYTTRNIEHGVTDPNSGGNVVYLTPSLYLAAKQAIFQLGVGVPVAQHVNGNQGLSHYLVIGNFGWTF